MQGELSFGCNMVYKLFDRTKWRPTYHFIVDIIYTKNLYQEITDHVEALMVTHDVAYRAMKEHPKSWFMPTSIPRRIIRSEGTCWRTISRRGPRSCPL